MGGKSSPSGYTTNTTTQSTQPWAAQIPYLEQGFGAASNLYNNYTPQYFPTSTQAPQTWQQGSGITQLGQMADYLQGQVTPNVSAALNSLLTGPDNFANYPGINTLANLSGTNIATQNPAYGTLSNIALGGIPGLGSATGLAGSAPSAGMSFLQNAYPTSSGTLASYASGSQTDPFLSALSQSVASSVLPGIQQQFIAGGGLSNPQAAYSSSQGLTAGLAPVLSAADLAEQTNQLTGATNLGNLANQFASTTSNIYNTSAQNIANMLSGNVGAQLTAGQDLGTQLIQGGSVQTQGAQDLASQYAQELQTKLGALQATPADISAMLTPSAALYQAGTEQQNQVQADLNAQIGRWNYNQTLPYNQLNQYLQEIGGSYGGTGTGTSSQPFYSNTGANILSGALGTAALGNVLGGSGGWGSILSGLGLGGSAGLGTTGSGFIGSSGLLDPALAGVSGAGVGLGTTGTGLIGGSGVLDALALLGLSDRRLKTDVRRIGTAANGLPLYAFRFHGEPHLQIGVMADEVEQVHPEAVSEGPLGFKMVDYEKALR